MMVTFVCECEKKALIRTRRVLDAFANRIGSRTWQTVITEEGLQAVKKLLRKTATKNTAVACHWIRSRSRSELVWIVGNRSKFNQDGYVPVNLTQEEGLINKNEYYWSTTKVIALLSSIAGLFHDFGKANKLFQEKLDPNISGKNYEPYRHEWVSLRLFEGFVRAYTTDFSSDQEWLQALASVNNSAEDKVMGVLIKDNPSTTEKPFTDLPPIAKVIAWLVVSHHRLPIYPYSRDEKIANNPPAYFIMKKDGEKDFLIDNWLYKNFDSLWNSPSSFNEEWEQNVRKDNWTFPHGTPFLSAIWQIKASELAEKALNNPLLFQCDWLNQRFTAHLSRLSLMLSDHYYSASISTPSWQDRNYDCYANTDGNKKPKQKLDEHNIGVGTKAYELAKDLARLRNNLPVITANKKFTKNNYQNEQEKQSFGWQDKAYYLANELQENTKENGFLGINMASTGKGKTIANARIMHALADANQGCRFNIALGLRTLTLQTGRALAKMLELKDEDYAVLIGSQAIKKLFDKDKAAQQKEEQQQFESYQGSESVAELFPENQHIEYAGIPNNEILSTWLNNNSRLQKLIDAPLLISTIDHLVPATEGTRGGKQIAPMLRLLTSDLVIDEPDDFGLEDLQALCRLVNWAAMMGGRVLLSTATMPPALAYALFQSYQAGWKDYTQVNGEKGASDKICCAWFDEFAQQSAVTTDFKQYKQCHDKFVEKRISNLTKDDTVLRKARFLPIRCTNQENVIPELANVIVSAIHSLHQYHHQAHQSGKTVSIGLVRMANINPLVALAKALLQIKPQGNYRIHYCVYHGQYPLAVRNHIEEKLDAALRRDNEELLWQQQEIKQAVDKLPEKHHIFVVLASPVAEVGRDHDYDWAIAEPSSMRSLIQLAGRIQRHRKNSPATENLLILSKNVKALQGKYPAYNKPGFEVNVQQNNGNNNRSLSSFDLYDVLNQKQIIQINAIPRIQPLKARPKRDTEGKYLDFVEMEQWALFQQLLGADNQCDKASYWWENQATWCAEIQRRQPFRQSSPDAPYCLRINEDGTVYWARKDNTKKITVYPPMDNMTEEVDLAISEGNQVWLNYIPSEIFISLAHLFESEDITKISEQFGELRLRVNTNRNRPDIAWYYHPYLGVHE